MELIALNTLNTELLSSCWCLLHIYVGYSIVEGNRPWLNVNCV